MTRKWDRKQIWALIAVGLVLGIVTASAASVILSDGVSVQGGVTLAAGSGPVVNVTGTTNVSLSDPFPDQNTLDLTTEEGNVTFRSNGPANATIHVSEITGTWTNVTDLNVSNNDLTINPGDKVSISVGGDADNLSYRSMTIDDGQIDFVYGGASGHTRLNITGIASNTRIHAIDPSTGSSVGFGTTDANGNVSLNLTNSVHAVTLQSTEGPPTQSNPSPTGDLSTPPSELAITVDDPDFPNDEVNVTFFLNGNNLGGQNITSQTRVTQGSLGPHLQNGTNTWAVRATDKWGQTTNKTYTFNIPMTLFLRNETNVSELIDAPLTADLTFYGSGETIEDRQITNGELNLSNLPVDETFVVTIEASEDYHRRTFIIDSLYEQQTAFLLSKNISSNNITFALQDFTGNFPAGEETTILIERAINRSDYPEDGNGLQWTLVSGDRLDAAGEFTDNLQTGERYRIKVRNSNNDLRVLGSFTPREDTTAILQVRGLTFGVNGTIDEWSWNTTIMNSTGSPSGKKIVFNFTDPDDSTTDLRLKIYERGNASNEIHNTSYPGPFGNLSVSENIPAGENETAWVVDFTATHDGSSISQQRVLSQRSSLVPTLDIFWKQVASILIILMVAFLFSRINAAIGGVVTAIVAGMLWQIQWMGGATSGAAILIAIATAAWVHYAGRETVP